MSYRPWTLVLAAALAAGCDTAPRIPTTFQKVGGDAQTATVGTQVSTAPSVRVLDQDGEPLVGGTVTFDVAEGGGSAQTPSALTDAAGVASVGRWTLGTQAGRNVLRATVQGLTSVTFEATGTPDVPAAVAFTAGANQQGRVAEALTIAPTVRVTDAHGNPTPSVDVTFQVVAGGGQLTGGSQTTNAAGAATAGPWTLGEQTGENRVEARVAGVTPASLTSTATAGAPAAAAAHQGNAQTARVDTDIPVGPSVRVIDRFGNPVGGVVVSFSTAAGSGVVEPANVTTDQAGVAAATRWHLGTGVGTHTATAQVEGVAAVTLTATATAGPAAAVAAVAAQSQTGAAGIAVAVRPSVRVHDIHGNPVPGAGVTFAVVSGGGSVGGASQVTGNDGIATVGSWVLGGSIGTNALEARVGSLPAVTFTAEATAGAPASITVVVGDNQSAAAGANVAVAPSVRIRDAQGNVVPGVAVSFVVTQGGGSVTGSPSTTGFDGVATVGSWRLGVAGTNMLEARVGGLTPGLFTATGTGGGGGGGGSGTFDIDLRFGSGLTPSQQAIFAQAVARWESVITGDLPSSQITAPADQCGTHPAINEVVDDLLIFAAAEAIDGVGSVLGRAGPCYIRNTGSLPVVGFMEFDAADIAALEASGDLLPVILHEIGHVLGIGTIWELLGLLDGKGTAIPSFTGAGAIAAFDAVGGSSFVARPKVPVEDGGGSGTRDSHWDEEVMDAELMTGFYDSGVANPMSLVTVRSLADLGYTVDLTKAESYALTGLLRAPGAATQQLQLIELPLPTPGRVGERGEILSLPTPPRR